MNLKLLTNSQLRSLILKLAIELDKRGENMIINIDHKVEEFDNGNLQWGDL